MKFIIGVVTFAAAQLQIANLVLCEPQFDSVENPTPQAEVAEIEIHNDTKTTKSVSNQLPVAVKPVLKKT